MTAAQISQIERHNNLEVALRTLLDGFRANLWTAMPCKVKKYDPVKGTVDGLVTIRDIQFDLLGRHDWVELPPLLDLPVVWPRGGGLVMTFPIAVGDEFLAVFANRCIDAWWQTGADFSNQAEFRPNELSDGFALFGPSSRPNVAPNPSTDSVQIRTQDGSTFVEVTQGGAVNVTSTAPTTVNAPSIELSDGGAIRKLVTDTFLTLFNAHTHPVTGGSTGVPVTPADATYATTVTKAE